jgi:probable phosphoglycerate mutase
MTKIILVRHGETKWCAERRVRGAVDIPLNSKGKKQAQEIADKLSGLKIKAVYSGEAACSLSTASEIAALHNLKVKKISELNELNMGVWQGLLLDDIKKHHKKQYNAWKSSSTSGHPPGGESAKDAYDRAVSAMHKLIDRHKDENICVVSGSVTLSMLKSQFKNMNFEKMWKAIPEKTWWEVLEL